MGLLKERLHICGSRMVFFCEIEGANGGFEVFGIKLVVCLSQETRERVRVQCKSFGAVRSRFLLIDLVSVLVQRSKRFAVQGSILLCSTRKTSQLDGHRAHLESSYVCNHPP